MYEVERKMRVSHTDIRDRLDALSAEFLGTVAQRDTYFAHPQRSFAATDEALRVRAERPVAGNPETDDRLTYKGPRLDEAAKTRREVETAIDNVEAAIRIFEALDFSPAHIVEKTRERYRTEAAHVCLDAVDGLGEFLEIEARNGEDIDAATAATESVLEQLGIADAPEVTRSYLALVLEE